MSTGSYEAWTSKNLDKAMTYIAEDIVCDAPAGRLEGAEVYRAFMAPFTHSRFVFDRAPFDAARKAAT